MKRAGRLWMALFAVVLGSCAETGVTSTYDPAVDFSTLKSYAWMPAQKEGSGHPRVDDVALDATIRAAVDRELEARGCKKRAEDRADFLVGYAALVTRQKEERIIGSRQVYSATDVHSRYVDSGRELAVRNREIQVIDFHQGSLILSFHDPGSMRVVWRATGTVIVDFEADPAESAKKVDELVRQLLGHFPPPSGS